MNKLGIELKTDVTSTMTPRQLLGEQLKTQIQEVEAKTGITLPTYYNPGVMNPLKYAQQIQKRKLLWGNKVRSNLFFVYVKMYLRNFINDKLFFIYFLEQ